jgi:hypothetical protein
MIGNPQAHDRRFCMTHVREVGRLTARVEDCRVARYPRRMTLLRPLAIEHPPVPAVAPRPPFVHVPA